MGEQDPQIGKNNRQRCFQLVGGIGNKLILLFPGGLHRTEGETCKEYADDQKAQQGKRKSQDAGKDQLLQSVCFLYGICERDFQAIRSQLFEEAQLQVGEKALFLSGEKGFFYGFFGKRFCDL